MRTMEQIKLEGYEALSEKLGLVDAEKFIAQILSEPFDYTEWQREYFKGKSAADFSREAMNLRKSGK